MNGRLIDQERHFLRLDRSLGAVSIPKTLDHSALKIAMETLISKNELEEGLIYLQISRGSADRDFLVHGDPTPTTVMFTQAKNLRDYKPIKVMTVPDIRWRRRDIKSVGLLGPVMAKEEARLNGFDDAWMEEDGFITEGTSNNAYIVDADGVLITRPLSNDILHGITRTAILTLAEKDDIRVEERVFSKEEAYVAKEAMITSASTFVWPVIQIDDRVIGNGEPGPITLKLRQHYIDAVLKETGV